MMIGDLNGKTAADTVAGIARETGNDCRGMKRDVTSLDEINGMVKATAAAFGGISTLIDNVGRGGRQPDPAAIPEGELVKSCKPTTISAHRMSMACLPCPEKANNTAITSSASFSSAAPARDILPCATARAAPNPMMVSRAHLPNKRVRGTPS